MQEGAGNTDKLIELHEMLGEVYSMLGMAVEALQAYDTAMGYVPQANAKGFKEQAKHK